LSPALLSGRRVVLTVVAGVTASAALAGVLAVPAASAASSCPLPRIGVLRSTPATYPRTVALTFDDGPGPYTPKILAVLRAKKVHATFFETGLHVAANPAMARRVVVEGNRIGNHTYTHPQYTVPGMKAFDRMSASAQAKELDSTTSAIRAATGALPCFFRGPGGHQFGATTQSLVRARHMANVYWSEVTGDSAQPGSYSAASVSAYVALATVRRSSPDHPIILMHDGNATPKTNPNRYRGNTVAALPKIIDYYRARGFVFTDPSGHRFAADGSR
jgi:peptidoglycan/xylan/chitin deacetylase (PgdA/CDA1 family)